MYKGKAALQLDSQKSTPIRKRKASDKLEAFCSNGSSQVSSRKAAEFEAAESLCSLISASVTNKSKKRKFKSPTLGEKEKKQQKTQASNVDRPSAQVCAREELQNESFSQEETPCELISAQVAFKLNRSAAKTVPDDCAAEKRKLSRLAPRMTNCLLQAATHSLLVNQELTLNQSQKVVRVAPQSPPLPIFELRGKVVFGALTFDLPLAYEMASNEFANRPVLAHPALAFHRDCLREIPVAPIVKIIMAPQESMTFAVCKDTQPPARSKTKPVPIAPRPA